jgi:hypothetical protein
MDVQGAILLRAFNTWHDKVGQLEQMAVIDKHVCHILAQVMHFSISMAVGDRHHAPGRVHKV